MWHGQKPEVYLCAPKRGLGRVELSIVGVAWPPVLKHQVPPQQTLWEDLLPGWLHYMSEMKSISKS